MPNLLIYIPRQQISTNGDMQTMDVIFPASPMFLYSNPELLKRLLLPVLSFANNETGTFFSNVSPWSSGPQSEHKLNECEAQLTLDSVAMLQPFSPHQIGTYPIADATTASQVRNRGCGTKAVTF